MRLRAASFNRTTPRTLETASAAVSFHEFTQNTLYSNSRSDMPFAFVLFSRFGPSFVSPSLLFLCYFLSFFWSYFPCSIGWVFSLSILLYSRAFSVHFPLLCLTDLLAIYLEGRKLNSLQESSKRAGKLSKGKRRPSALGRVIPLSAHLKWWTDRRIFRGSSTYFGLAGCDITSTDFLYTRFYWFSVTPLILLLIPAVRQRQLVSWGVVAQQGGVLGRDFSARVTF